MCDRKFFAHLLFSKVRLCDSTFHRSFQECDCAIALFGCSFKKCNFAIALFGRFLKSWFLRLHIFDALLKSLIVRSHFSKVQKMYDRTNPLLHNSSFKKSECAKKSA